MAAKRNHFLVIINILIVC